MQCSEIITDAVTPLANVGVDPRAVGVAVCPEWGSSAWRAI